MKKYEISRRKEKVMELAKAGQSNYEIAESLEEDGIKTSERTVRRDIFAIRDKLEKDGRINAKDVYLDIDDHVQEIYERAWNISENSTDSGTKIKALRLLLDVTTRKADIIAKLGLTEAMPENSGNVMTYENIKAIIDRNKRERELIGG